MALFEVEALFGSPLTPGGMAANPAASWLTINAQVQLIRIADLTDAEIPLNSSTQELTGDWRSYSHRATSAPTQELEAALHALTFFEGF